MTTSDILQSPAMTAIDVVMEPNHRIANHLATIVSLARKQATAMKAGPALIPRDSAVEAMTGLVSKIIAVSTLHRRLAEQPADAELELGDFVRDVLQELRILYGDRLRVAMSIAAGCKVDAAHASILAFAFSEVVTNAMKYAHPTGLPVEITVAAGSLRGGGLTVEISDDGVGLPEGFDQERDAGVGLRMLQYLMESAGGHLRTSSDELGLTFSLDLPGR